METNRRRFIKTGLLAATALPVHGALGEDKSIPFSINKGFMEPSRSLPIAKQTEVIVCGGGPAGIAAAIASARQGAKTTLIEMYGCLGGIWTTGLLSYIIDYENKPGIMKELVNNLEKSDAQHFAKVYDAELMKWTLDKMCLDAGVEVRLHTKVTAAYKNAKNSLEYITTESFSGREAWKAKVFIDTTGNGELAAQAGCYFDIGHPESGKTQPMSLMALLTGVKEDELNNGGLMKKIGYPTASEKNFLYSEIERAGLNASYTKPTLFGVRDGLVAMMANHQYGVSILDAKQVSKATIEARAEVNNIVNGLRSLGGVWSNVRLVSTASQIGVREGRRIHGRYMITKEDLIKGAQFDDGVCSVDFGVDVHSLEKKDGGGYGGHGIKSKPYEIPLGALIAKDVDGLMMAGRCISGDFFAHASYRVTGNAVAMGEAAGQVAGQAALENKRPQEIKYRKV
ncbi:FAD-dependent oxidoreductase [Ulvibacterium marinum]|uniref:FAD-dependent oxidoreductase n=1 Tax=Ulvibacterium marinum TaxID=2419782 RepID=A0A3B0CAE5_9FLAO|nr:FAD-dependent oxidoreductase [Ulvibacterium marinum]RKN83455.1 FAD-dependent oxidoreductase [Ulvibacterium marinum]